MALPIEKIPVILDCDNTFGIPRGEVDDGLTLLYLLGCPEVELLGVTCSGGNAPQSTVYRNTVRLLHTWGRDDIPVVRGCEDADDRQSPAADFLAEQARIHAGCLRVIATGSMSNLLGAAQQDPGFFGNVAAFSLMGGLTEPLLVGGRPMDEFTLSCDPAASLSLLRRENRVYLATATNCLASFFPRTEFKMQLRQHGGSIARYLESSLEYWYDLNAHEWNRQGIVVWGVMAAVQLLHPEYFDMVKAPVTPTLKSLESGQLIGGGAPLQVWQPRIKNRSGYVDHVYDTYFSADIHPII